MQSMENEIVFAGLPFQLGNPLKTPSTAWRNWRIYWESENEFRRLAAMSETYYQNEWEDTSQMRLEAIATASCRAGLSDCNTALNTAVAEAVLRHVDTLPSGFSMLDVGTGAGNAALAVLKRVDSAKAIAQLHLVDPAKRSLNHAGARILDSELVPKHGLFLHATTDLHLPNLFPSPKFDLIVSSAALHHHGHLEPAIGAIAHCLKPGGLLVVGDWHNSMWTDPGRVYELLRSLSWSEKGGDLARFANRYPTTPVAEPDPLLRMANEQISAFWRAYTGVRTAKPLSSQMLEGHRPPADYTILARKSGLHTVEPPQPLFPDSALLCVHVARKPTA